MDGKAFEELVFALIHDYPFKFDLKLWKGGKVENVNLRDKTNVVVKNFGRQHQGQRGVIIPERPFNFSQELMKEDLIIHIPTDKSYPNVDGMLEFMDGENKTLVFLQISLDTPSKHTSGKKSRENFFSEEGSEYLALDIYWDKFTIAEKPGEAVLKQYEEENIKKVQAIIDEQDKNFTREDMSGFVKNAKTEVIDKLKDELKAFQETKRLNRLEHLKAVYPEFNSYSKHFVWVMLKKGPKTQPFNLGKNKKTNVLYDHQTIVDTPFIDHYFTKL